MPFDAKELRKFTDAGEAISKAAGIGFEQWAEGEAGMILSGWTALINAQTVPEAEKRARNRVLNRLGLTKGKVTINSGVRGKEGTVWIRARNKRFMLAGSVDHNAGAFSPNPKRHFSAEQWRDGSACVKDYQAAAGVIAIAKRTIGLARQSVVQIADALGIALERIAGGLPAADIGRARSAVAGDGKSYQNGFGERKKSGGTFSIELINRYPNLTEAKIDSALATVVGQRLGLMERALADKMALSTGEAAKAFPYLQITR